MSNTFLIHTSLSDLQGLNPISLISCLSADSQAETAPFKPYNALITTTTFLLFMPHYCPVRNQTISLDLAFRYVFCMSEQFTPRTFISTIINTIHTLYLDKKETNVMDGGVPTLCPYAMILAFQVNQSSNLTSNIMCVVIFKPTWVSFTSLFNIKHDDFISRIFLH